MKKVLVSRYGAYGDTICISFLPRLLKDQGFDVVDFEVNHKGFQVLGNNPFIDNLFYFEPSVHLKEHTAQAVQDHWDEISKGYDKFINLFASLEVGCIAMEGDDLYDKSDEERRSILGNINFYDQTCAWAGYEELCGKYMPELFFTDEEIEKTERYLEQFKDKFIVLVNVSGTSKHKRFVQAREFCKLVTDRYEDAQIILTGDDQSLEFSGERIESIIRKKPFMQAALIAKYAHCVIAMESGLGIAANVWNTPNIFLLTASSWHSVARYHPRCITVQSPAHCSPCHKGPYEYRGCEMSSGLPICVNFNMEEIMGAFDSIYKASVCV